MPSSKGHRRNQAIRRQGTAGAPTKKQRDLLKTLSARLKIPPPIVATKAEASREIEVLISAVDAETGRAHMRSILG